MTLMPRYRIYAKRSTINEYEVEAESEAHAEQMARAHLEKHYYLSDPTEDENGEPVASVFEDIGGDDSEEEFMSIEEA